MSWRLGQSICKPHVWKRIFYKIHKDISEEELLNIIKQLNDDLNITALICQLPLPKHISEQKVIEAMIANLSERLANAEVVDIKAFAGDKINFGATVKLLDLNTDKEVQYTLLSEFESDISKGILAVESLVGKSLIGKEKGDEIEIKTPAGIKEYEILDVQYIEK